MRFCRSFLPVMLAAASCILAPTSVGCQAAPRAPDHLPSVLSDPGLRMAGLLLAAAFLGDEGVRREFRPYRETEMHSLARVGNAFGDPRYVLPALGVGYLTGHVTGRPSLQRATLRAGTAALLASGVTTVLKYSVGRGRPGRNDDGAGLRPFSGWNAFPSGHATFAFAVATSLAHETPDRWSDVAFYGVATLTAFARVHDDTGPRTSLPAP